MFNEVSVQLRFPGEVLLVRTNRSGAMRSDPEAEVAARALFVFRFGLETRDTRALEAARTLLRHLDGATAFEVRGERLRQSPVLSQDLARRIAGEFARGRLVAEFRTTDSLRDDVEAVELELPPLPPRRSESTDTFFEVRFVDEVGQAINGVAVEFALAGKRSTVTTNAAGVALLEHAEAASASVSVPETKELERALAPRWTAPRQGKAPNEANTTTLPFRGAPIAPISVRPVVPNTVVLTPPSGCLFVELFDKTGRQRHKDRAYTITGPMSFEGRTDASGRLRHDGVFPGDYSLELELEFFEDTDPISESHESPLVVLEPAAAEPELRMLGVVPRSVLARLRMWFNTNKSFLLPTALPGVRKLRKLYRDNDPCELLVVGHADTTAGAATNDPLSLERAKSVIAFLEDDVDAWLAFYETGIPEARRWGSVEDRLMIVSMPGFADKPKGQDKVRWFQQTRGLGVDGKAGPETRRKLIEEYMSLDGASLTDEGLQITATAHGCGEHFPLDETGEGLDPKPADPKRDPVDRRVELFFFEPEFGIMPKPPGENSAAGSTQYPEWRRSVTETHELGAGDVEGPRVLFLELVDALFRTNSAVIMPEGERPSSDSSEHEAFTSLGVFATVLRFNDEHPGKKLLIAGHTDTTASVDFNQTLSEERARVALALLVGGDDQREEWKTLCDGRHTISDIKQILAWAPKGLAPLVFDCDPGRIDEVEGTLVEPLRRFQNAYNANKAELNPLADDLAPDGDLGPLTWGAVFDCYELALRRELKLERPELEALRAKLEFVDPEQRALGFSEHFPVEELGVDNFKSQSNRRVEILFFDPDEAPDVPSMASDPETAEIYLPGRYEREPLEPLLDRFIDLEIRLHDGAARPLGAVPCRMTLGSDVQESTASADGFVTFSLPGLSCPDLAKLEWGVPEADGSFPFSREILVECEEGDERQQATAKLFNLGYPSFTDEEFEQAVRDFQFDYDIPEQGLTSGNELPPETRRRLFTIYATDCDATRPERRPADDEPAADDEEELEIVSSAGSCFDGLA